MALRFLLIFCCGILVNTNHPLRFMNILECDGIMLEFGLRKILSGIYLKCETGQIVGLLGRNGSGKSCLMKVITCSMQAESKSIRIDETPILPDFSKNGIAYLPQHHFIPSFLKIRDAFKIYGVSLDATTKYFSELDKHFDLKPSQISGGVLRIFEVMLVSGLPVKFVLMDEPFSGIMPLHILQMQEYLIEIKETKGILITDHLYRHIITIADTLYVLVNGQNYQVKNEEQLIQYGYINS
jgi:ABC-type multidrug transport system ATPase subunit